MKRIPSALAVLGVISIATLLLIVGQVFVSDSARLAGRWHYDLMGRKVMDFIRMGK